MQSKANAPYVGVDISSLNSISDEALLFSQIDFMYCRAYGRDHTGTGDSQTANFVAAARRNNCPVGAYYFGVPFVDAAAGVSTDAQIAANAETQAQQFIDKLYSVFGQGNVGDLIPCVDVEQYVDATTQYGHTATQNTRYPQAVMTNAQLQVWIMAFKNYFNTNTGKRVGMYTGEYWLTAPPPTEGIGMTNTQLTEINSDYLPLWIARYDEYNASNDVVANLGTWTQYIAWQYTGIGNASAYGVYHVDNYLDLNRASDLNLLYVQDYGVSTPEPATGVNLGANPLSKMFLGANSIERLFLGANKIFEKVTAPITTISPAEVVQNNIPITVTLTTDEAGAVIHYRIGSNTTVYTYTGPFTVNQNNAGVQGTDIPVTYWAVGAEGTEAEKTIVYNTSGAIPEKPILTATAGTNSIVLDWQPTANTTSYSVFRSEVLGQEGTAIANYISPDTFTDTTAVAGTTYYYKVKALNYLNGNSSDQVAATIPVATAPKGYRYIRQWMNGGWTGAATTELNSLLEFQAISTSGGNVLLGKANLEGWVGKLAGTTNPPSNITDGVTTDMYNYCVWSDSTTNIPQKITYDMGKLYTDLTSVKTWHNYASTGRYYNFKIQVCATNSANDADWTTIVDAMNNETVKTRQETSAGFTFTVPAVV